MEGQALVVEHDVIRTRNPDQERDACCPQKDHQVIHIILICFGVVGVTGITAHRHAEQFGAEMIFQRGPDDLLAVIKIFRADKAHDRIHQQGVIGPCYGVGAGLHGLLVNTVMSFGGQRSALTRLKIHDIIAKSATIESQRCLMSFFQNPETDAKAFIGFLCPRNGLKDQIDRAAAVHDLDRVCNVCQNAGLGRNVIALAGVVEHLQKSEAVRDAVGRGVNADDGIPHPAQKTVQS